MRQYHEPWADCDICGFTRPQSQLQRHYLTGRLVDAKCADQPGADDYRRWARQRAEARRHSEQPVADQGTVGPGAGFGVTPFGDAPFGDPS